MTKKRQIYKYCPVAEKVVPIEEARRNEYETKHANVAHGYIPDDMEATKHPLDGRYYTSKSKFREVTRAHGYEEVGTAYDKGYDPGADKPKREAALARSIIEQIRDRRYGSG